MKSDRILMRFKDFKDSVGVRYTHDQEEDFRFVISKIKRNGLFVSDVGEDLPRWSAGDDAICYVSKVDLLLVKTKIYELL